jgi:hypothetical protein
MILFDMKIQEMLSRKILPALQTTVGVSLRIMNIVFFIRCKRESLAVWWKRTAHFSNWVSFTAL